MFRDVAGCSKQHQPDEIAPLGWLKLFMAEQEGDKFSLALAKTINMDNTPTDGTFSAVSL